MSYLFEIPLRVLGRTETRTLQIDNPNPVDGGGEVCNLGPANNSNQPSQRKPIHSLISSIAQTFAFLKNKNANIDEVN